MSDRPNEIGYSRAWMLRECEASLQRLRTDHIDIYYLHRDYDGLDLEEPLRAIDTLLRDGKIRYWGVSNFRGWRIAEAVHGARQLGMPGRWSASRTTTCSTGSPRSRCCRPACTTASASCPTARSRAACSPPSTRPGASPAEGTRAGRGDTRMMQTEFREESLRAAQTLKAHCEKQGRRAVAVRDRLGAGAPRGELGDRRPAHLRAVAGLPVGALDCAIDDADEALVDALVAPGHPSTPGYNDPQYPLPRRRR